MRIDESYYFECLRCGEQAHMVGAPRCPKCNSGNGIVHERELSLPLSPDADPVSRAMTV
jgi:Zn finger protein HypA/HybF involved in hydrogenase expression